jgi:hypothetical protein
MGGYGSRGEEAMVGILRRIAVPLVIAALAAIYVQGIRGALLT